MPSGAPKSRAVICVQLQTLVRIQEPLYKIMFMCVVALDMGILLDGHRYNTAMDIYGVVTK